MLINNYACIYEKTYGSKESIEQLIPYMIASFLDNDHAFKKAKKQFSEIKS
ncbi:MAG: DUF2274 domain-containing protein [Flavobacteriaceae bacterium]|nr:DUF2274 domain-containing protein [Flavobacteriaceae bacterium]